MIKVSNSISISNEEDILWTHFTRHLRIYKAARNQFFKCWKSFDQSSCFIYQRTQPSSTNSWEVRLYQFHCFQEGFFLASAESPKPRLSLFYHFLLTSQVQVFMVFFVCFFFHSFNTFSITRLVKAPFSVTEEASKGIINKMRIFFSLSGKQSRKHKAKQHIAAANYIVLLGSVLVLTTPNILQSPRGFSVIILQSYFLYSLFNFMILPV